MKKLKKLITRLAKDGDYASLGKIASIIEFVTETRLMSLHFFIMPFSEEPTAKAFLEELCNQGFGLVVPEGKFIWNITLDDLAAQYPDADYADVSFAWWTAIMIVISPDDSCFEFTISNLLCDFVAESFESAPAKTANEILKMWADEDFSKEAETIINTFMGCPNPTREVINAYRNSLSRHALQTLSGMCGWCEMDNSIGIASDGPCKGIEYPCRAALLLGKCPKGK